MYVVNLARPTNPVKKVIDPIRVHVRASPELKGYSALKTFSSGDPAELKSAGEVNGTATKIYKSEAVPQNVVLAYEQRGWFIGFLSICMYGRESLTDGAYINAVGRDWCYKGAHLSDGTARPGDALTCRGLETVQRLAGTGEVPEVHALVLPENAPSLDMLINRYGFSTEGMFIGQHVLVRRAGPAPKSLSAAVCELLPALVGHPCTPKRPGPRSAIPLP